MSRNPTPTPRSFLPPTPKAIRIEVGPYPYDVAYKLRSSFLNLYPFATPILNGGGSFSIRSYSPNDTRLAIEIPTSIDNANLLASAVLEATSLEEANPSFYR